MSRLPARGCRPSKKRSGKTAKEDASYWLGLIAFEQKNYPVAIDYFSRRTLDATPDGPWTDGAHYNLGRTYEALGQLDRRSSSFNPTVRRRSTATACVPAGSRRSSATAPTAEEKTP